MWQPGGVNVNAYPYRNSHGPPTRIAPKNPVAWHFLDIPTPKLMDMDGICFFQKCGQKCVKQDLFTAKNKK